jgi:hypothetical protein
MRSERLENRSRLHALNAVASVRRLVTIRAVNVAVTTIRHNGSGKGHGRFSGP